MLRMMMIEIDFLIIIVTGQVTGACGQQSLFYTGSGAEKIALKPKLDMETRKKWVLKFLCSRKTLKLKTRKIVRSFLREIL